MKKFSDSTRDFITEWTINILILLFGTTTLVQAFIVPTPSMDTTVRVGDHLLVDKLSYAPSGSISQTSAAVHGAEARRHHRVPLSDGHQPELREARDGRAGRPYPSGEQGRVPERQGAAGAVRPAHRSRRSIRIATISRSEPWTDPVFWIARERCWRSMW